MPPQYPGRGLGATVRLRRTLYERGDNRESAGRAGFGWSSVPPWLSVAGAVLILLSMWMAYRVFKENSFGSATVGIVKEQKVISTGRYAIVRNPMYSSAAVYFIGASLALGSYWGLIPAVLTIFGLIWRLFDEEQFLARNLPGYSEYCAKVRWHLILGLF